MTDQNEGQKRDELIFELMKKRYEDEKERNVKLDDQGRNLVGSVLVVVGFLLAAGTSGIFSPGRLVGNVIVVNLFAEILAFVFYFVGIAILFLSIVLVFIALRRRSWTIVPNVQILLDRYTQLTYGQVLARNSGEMSIALRHNEYTNNQKALLIMYAWVLLITGLAFVLVFIIVKILLLGPPAPH